MGRTRRKVRQKDGAIRAVLPAESDDYFDANGSATSAWIQKARLARRRSTRLATFGTIRQPIRRERAWSSSRHQETSWYFKRRPIISNFEYSRVSQSSTTRASWILPRNRRKWRNKLIAGCSALSLLKYFKTFQINFSACQTSFKINKLRQHREIFIENIQALVPNFPKNFCNDTFVFSVKDGYFGLTELKIKISDEVEAIKVCFFQFWCLKIRDSGDYSSRREPYRQSFISSYQFEGPIEVWFVADRQSNNGKLFW